MGGRMSVTGWAALAVLSAGVARAEDPTCDPDEPLLDGSRHLRALSLDLRGTLPEPAEYDELVAGEVPESMIDDWLASPAFADRVVRHHRSLLWNNVSNVTLLATNATLSTRDGIYWRRNLSDTYRGLLDTHCGTFEATLDAQGRPIPVDIGGGLVQEGWVWVAPYWSPDTPIQVCAYDAQTVRTSPLGTDCASLAGLDDPSCGCGPELQWCGISSQQVSVVEAFGTDVDLRVARIIEEDRSYLELLTGTTGFVNGPMVHFLKHQTAVPGGVRFTELPVDPSVLPDLDWTDEDTWVEIDLGPHHSGVLTSPAWLLRFQTNRARANRFYNSFLCQPFQPPDGGIDLSGSRTTLDLTVREGCKYCHALLEPTAAYWGRWSPGGAGYLDPEQFPAWDPTCAACAAGTIACTETCSKYYLTRVLSAEEDPYVGWLLSYEFLEERHTRNVDEGPELLVEETVVDGRLPHCVAESTASWLLGRPLTPEDDPWIDRLAVDLAADGWSYRSLVKAIVTSDEYRRVR